MAREDLHPSLAGEEVAANFDGIRRLFPARTHTAGCSSQL